MNQANLKSLKKISLFILLFAAAAYTARAQYTLTDDDVVVTDGVIVGMYPRYQDQIRQNAQYTRRYGAPRDT